MAIRTIVFLRKVRDEHTEAYYRRFEASMSMAKLAKFPTMIHMEINRTHSGGDNKYGTNRFQTMCLFMSTKSK